MTARAVAAPAPVEPAAGPADADAKTNNASTVAALTDPSSEHKLHVLLVEDDHATLVFVKALLKSCGHQGTCLSRARSRRARRPRARPAPTRSANSRVLASNRRAKLFFRSGGESVFAARDATATEADCVIPDRPRPSLPRTVTTAMNGKQAIDALLSPTQDVDLILTDIMMPEVDGMELMKIVQASDKPFRSIPIIIMSTVDSDEFKTKCGDAGATDYLVKPVRKQQMEALGRHASIGLNSSASTAAGASVGASGAEHTGARGPARDAGSGQNQKSGGTGSAMA